MELVLGDLGPDRRQFQDLVAKRLWVGAAQRVPAPATVRGLENLRVVGREPGPLLPRVTRLTARAAPRGRLRRAGL